MSSKPPEPAFVLRGAHVPISSIDFLKLGSQSGNLRYLASGSQEGLVSLWDLKVRCTQYQWKAHDSSVLWVKSLNPSNLWTCGRSEYVTLWDVDQSSAVKKAKFPVEDYLGFSLCDVVVFKNKTLLCVPGPTQENLSVWDVHSESKICVLASNVCQKWGCVMQCRWVICGHNLLVLITYENGMIALWDWANRKVLSSISCDDNPVSLEFSEPLMKGICGTVSEKVCVFQIQEETSSINIEKQFDITNPGVASVCSRPDGKIYALGGWDYRLRLYSWQKHKPLAVLIYHKKTINCLAYSSGSVESFDRGYLLAAGSGDNSISLWNVFN